ncbi:MAG: GntR family transcriptional regulator [Armatimonadota bacterium]
MQIQISPQEGVPIYQQIVNQVRHLVASGRLAPGEELPPIRVLAERLTINPNTVARAYRELEVAGVVAKRRTSGTYVSSGAAPMPRSERLALLADRIDALLADAEQLGLDVEALAGYLRERDACRREEPAKEGVR